MRHEYQIEGMTCGGCQAKVKSDLLRIPEVISVDVSLNPGHAVIEMSNHIPVSALQQAISPDKRYVIKESGNQASEMSRQEPKNWFLTYKPLLLIFGYISVSSLVAAIKSEAFSPATWMNYFMGGFFITFSFFKMLDLRGFADGYSSYDLLAGKWYSYGLLYPFIELLLGIWLLSGINLESAYWLILGLMAFSTLGVMKSLREKKDIRCACLGTIFKLPLGTVTLAEDSLMVAMAILMLVI